MNCSIICEDIAHFTFIENFLFCYGNQKYNGLSFKIIELFGNNFQGNNTRVFNMYPDAAIRAFRDYPIDLLFIGLDYDRRKVEDFDKEYKKLYERIDERFRNNSIIFFPVKAIEHWLWYIKIKIENPDILKNITLENKDNQEAKREIYQKIRPRKEKTIRTVKEYTLRMDIDWLRTRSESFNKFYKKLDDNIKKKDID